MPEVSADRASRRTVGDKVIRQLHAIRHHLNEGALVLEGRRLDHVLERVVQVDLVDEQRTDRRPRVTDPSIANPLLRAHTLLGMREDTTELREGHRALRRVRDLERRARGVAQLRKVDGLGGGELVGRQIEHLGEAWRAGER